PSRRSRPPPDRHRHRRLPPSGAHARRAPIGHQDRPVPSRSRRRSATPRCVVAWAVGRAPRHRRRSSAGAGGARTRAMTPTTACVLTAAGAATAALVESGRLRQRMSAMSPERLRPRWRAPTILAGPGVVAVAVIGGLAGAAWLGPVGFVVGAVGGGVGVVWATRLTTSRRQRIVRRQL